MNYYTIKPTEKLSEYVRYFGYVRVMLQKCDLLSGVESEKADWSSLKSE